MWRPVSTGTVPTPVPNNSMQLGNKLHAHCVAKSSIHVIFPAGFVARAALTRCTLSSSSNSNRTSTTADQAAPPAYAAPGSTTRNEGDKEHILRMQLGQHFPNALLLEASRLPALHTSKHFINLTNGLEMAPLLQQLQLQFSVVRIRSTNLEQQAFEALMLELDANLLLALALGHSCIIWDCGCRNRSDGAPRAVWYGVAFIRYALHHFWLGYGGAAYLRGHNVSDTFEQACRKFHPSTKKRLRYYKRYVTQRVQQQGVQLAGVFKKTQRDEDVDFFVDQAWDYCGVDASKSASEAAEAGAAGARGHSATAGGACHNGCMPTQVGETAEPSTAEKFAAVRAVSLQSFGASGECTVNGSSTGTAGPHDCQLTAADLDAYELLLSEGVGVFTAGISHAQFLSLKSDITADS